MTPRPYRVVARRREAAGTVTPVLETCGEPIPGVRPGRFTIATPAATTRRRRSTPA